MYIRTITLTCCFGLWLRLRYSRKRTVMFGYVALTVVGLVSAWLPLLSLILVARFCLGALHAFCSYSSFILLMEVLEPKRRTFAAFGINTVWGVTVMLYGGLGYLIRDWRILQTAATLPGLLILPALWCYRARNKPLINDRQRKKRLHFAKKYRDWPLDKWRALLWSDESTFCVSGGGPAKVYHRPGSDPTEPRYTRKTTKHPPSLMVWGCFTFHGIGNLVIFPKNTTVNKVVYFDLLNDHLEACFEKTQAQIFQQDGASCHTARDVIQWLDDCKIGRIDDWPGDRRVPAVAHVKRTAPGSPPGCSQSGSLGTAVDSILRRDEEAV
ncbi:Transposable element Tcb1 transposase [Chionoecetes opilio]|uniref:Transposable element Tcb1 transposase n=1 Tax=Chionoecetes opilio TaxID=41210 RepID=A0A8J4YG77_CHIOP|nr:Transposable element Tcb1 transposase [Chionoecetes opilio]